MLSHPNSDEGSNKDLTKIEISNRKNYKCLYKSYYNYHKQITNCLNAHLIMIWFDVYLLMKNCYIFHFFIKSSGRIQRIYNPFDRVCYTKQQQHCYILIRVLKCPINILIKN